MNPPKAHVHKGYRHYEWESLDEYSKRLGRVVLKVHSDHGNEIAGAIYYGKRLKRESLGFSYNIAKKRFSFYRYSMRLEVGGKHWVRSLLKEHMGMFENLDWTPLQIADLERQREELKTELDYISARIEWADGEIGKLTDRMKSKKAGE